LGDSEASQVGRARVRRAHRVGADRNPLEPSRTRNLQSV